MLSHSTSPRSHTSALASPFAGSPLLPGGALPVSRDAGGAHAAPAAGTAGGPTWPSHTGSKEAACNVHAAACRAESRPLCLCLAAGGEADARGSGSAPAGQAGAAPESAPVSGAVPQCPTPPLPPRHAHTLSGGSSGGSALPPGLPLAGGPTADGGGGSGGAPAAQAAAARRSSNALSELGAGVQSPGSTSRCGGPAERPWREAAERVAADAEPCVGPLKLRQFVVLKFRVRDRAGAHAPVKASMLRAPARVGRRGGRWRRS